jgi:hypothetical protein
MATDFYRQRYKEAVNSKENLNEMVHPKEREKAESPFASKVCEGCEHLGSDVQWKRDPIAAKQDVFVWFFLCRRCS